MKRQLSESGDEGGMEVEGATPASKRHREETTAGPSEGAAMHVLHDGLSTVYWYFMWLLISVCITCGLCLPSLQ